MPRTVPLLTMLVLCILAACGTLEEPPPSTERAASRSNPTRTPAPTASPEPTFDLAAFLAVPADDPRALGDPDAPITIIEYSDFE